MKVSVVIASAILALGLAMSIQFAEADTRQANCEVRKNGETKQGKSGACSFAQRQGYIDIDLRNGDIYNLRPGNQANHYRDQKGNKVVRTSSSGNTQEFKWEGGTRMIITFSSHGNNGYGHNQGMAARNTSAGTTMPSKAALTIRTGIPRTTRTVTGRVNRTVTGSSRGTNATDRQDGSRTQARHR